ncbi:uncharacterized protein LOC5516260 [Nematostella vectensis]|uniref:uncharacterized protein LOC5516260 n=1 Tax=Nematostella vectensis TaxID=45351 RepID=UPI0013901B83|nr:uncharacterized protein LOC5516260 [Nematostella vectensis]
MSKLLLILLCFTVINLSNTTKTNIRGENEESGRKSSKNEEFYVGGIPYLADAISSLVWFIRGLLGFFYFIMNTVLLTVTQLAARALRILQNVVRFVEFIGYCVRVVMQANYNFVMSTFKSTKQYAQNCSEFIRHLFESTIDTFISMLRTACGLLHSVVVGIPRLFEFAGSVCKTSLQSAGSVAEKSYVKCKHVATTVASVPGSAAWEIINAINAVIQLIISTIINTFLILYDLSRAVFSFIRKTVVTIIKTFWSYLLRFLVQSGEVLEIVGYGMSKTATVITNSAYHGFDRIYNTVAYVIGTIYYGVITTIDNLLWVIKSIFSLMIRAVTTSLSGVHSALSETMKNIQNALYYLSSKFPGGKLSMISLVSIGMITYSVRFLFGLNVGVVCFDILEKAIQNFVSRINRRSIISQQVTVVAEEERPSTTLDNKPSVSNDEHVNRLREELERERDKTLCVICAEQPKQILIMPCRHMCLCSVCADTLLTHWNRRACPLCRCRIRSLIEVYS